ncbi:MAG: hypothetical protein KAU20_02300 [Nanoarchaeota archaeon]|nr:hypothetical protein [Nanoarchaeota archaeon]
MEDKEIQRRLDNLLSGRKLGSAEKALKDMSHEQLYEFLYKDFHTVQHTLAFRILIDRLVESEKKFLRIEDAHKFIQCINDCQFLFNGIGVQQMARKLISDIKEILKGRYICPECSAEWDVEHNRCSANCQTEKTENIT